MVSGIGGGARRALLGLAAVATLAGGLAAANPAKADGWDRGDRGGWDRGRDWGRDHDRWDGWRAHAWREHEWREHERYYGGGYYYARPRIYYPPPAYYAPQPYYPGGFTVTIPIR
jgi:hypothetical protein